MVVKADLKPYDYMALVSSAGCWCCWRLGGVTWWCDRGWVVRPGWTVMDLKRCDYMALESSVGGCGSAGVACAWRQLLAAQCSNLCCRAS